MSLRWVYEPRTATMPAQSASDGGGDTATPVPTAERCVNVSANIVEASATFTS